MTALALTATAREAAIVGAMVVRAQSGRLFFEGIGMVEVHEGDVEYHYQVPHIPGWNLRRRVWLREALADQRSHEVANARVVLHVMTDEGRVHARRIIQEPTRRSY